MRRRAIPYWRRAPLSSETRCSVRVTAATSRSTSSRRLRFRAVSTCWIRAASTSPTFTAAGLRSSSESGSSAPPARGPETGTAAAEPAPTGGGGGAGGAKGAGGPGGERGTGGAGRRGGAAGGPDDGGSTGSADSAALPPGRARAAGGGEGSWVTSGTPLRFTVRMSCIASQLRITFFTRDRLRLTELSDDTNVGVGTHPPVV